MADSYWTADGWGNQPPGHGSVGWRRLLCTARSGADESRAEHSDWSSIHGSQELHQESGTVVKEFISPAGKVFAVSWSGPFIPDLRQLLGEYFDKFSQLAQTRARRPGRAPLMIEQDGLVVQSGGHNARIHRKKLYITDKLPEGSPPMRFARTEALRRASMFCLCGSLALAAGCGGGSNNSNSNNSGTPTQNTQPIAVNGGPQAAINLSGIYLNGAFTSVTVCVPGSATSCQTIDGVLVETGSFGLRLLSSTSGGELTLALPTTSIRGAHSANAPSLSTCLFFGAR